MESIPLHYGPKRLALSATQDELNFPVQSALRNAFNAWEVYSLHPKAMKGTVAVKAQDSLAPDGSNLAGVLHTAKSGSDEAFSRANQYLCALLPGSTDLLTPVTENGTTYVAVRDPASGGEVAAPHLSDGTVSILGLCALLCADPAPGLVCIEEPENFLHPRDLGIVADLLKDISERSQVIITTHSPHLLDHFKPEDLIVFDKEDGATRCERLKDDYIVKLRETLKDTSLGELWFSGVLGGVPER